jgi:enamine deaminase RidA (YjgF/YER057c/UK114 family)
MPASRWSSRADGTSVISGSIERFGSDGPWETAYGYSRAVRCGDLVLVAGTTAVTEDGVVLGHGDAGVQAEAILDGIERALAQAGARLDQVVRTRMFVTDIGHAGEVGRAHGARFGAHPPVSTMVEVQALLDPRMLVEIEAVAYVGPSGS